jgi:lipoyl(octanoyl) transferase
MVIVNPLGQMPYRDALSVMEECHAIVSKDPTHKGFLLCVEHPRTITMGLRDLGDDLLVSPEALAHQGIHFEKIDRGGSVTAHEPGQAVVYPIIRLTSYGLTPKAYIFFLEETVIRFCALYGVKAQRDEINPGVYVGSHKVAALGVRFKDRVTKHGLAFNLTNDLHTFRTIIPCGIKSRGVTTLEREIKGEEKVLTSLQETFFLFFQEELKAFLSKQSELEF